MKIIIDRTGDRDGHGGGHASRQCRGAWEEDRLCRLVPPPSKGGIEPLARRLEGYSRESCRLAASPSGRRTVAAERDPTVSVDDDDATTHDAPSYLLESTGSAVMLPVIPLRRVRRLDEHSPSDSARS